MKEKVTIFWFRRDLRLQDNVGLSKALSGNYPVLPIFIFDSEIIGHLPKNDARVTFIYNTLQTIRKTLQQKHNSGIAIYHGKVPDVFQHITTVFYVQNVITNHDYEPYAIKRDNEVEKLLLEKDIWFSSFKDQVIFEKEEVVKNDGTPYLVYTPYMKKWKLKLQESNFFVKTSSSEIKNYLKHKSLHNLSLADFGFIPSEIIVPEYNLSESLIKNYENNRDFPSPEGTSQIGAHLRFGTISIRQVAQKAIDEKNETFLNELIWREFFMQILWHFPKTQINSFKKKYDSIEWRNNENEFEKWKTGTTGYPLVDAGMRQLNKTGLMHNRVRMVTASFLTKHLLIDWRWGEAYFAEKLLDYEMASNIGNWQWVAGSGVDSSPYFRIFNPTTQLNKFDKNKEYIKKWIPELGSSEYPNEMVVHNEARERALSTYKEAVSSKTAMSLPVRPK